MTMTNPKQAAQNWVTGISNSTEKIRSGVRAVTVAPSEKAIAAIPRMVQGIQRAAQEGKIEAGLRRVGLQAWKDSMENKGIPRMATGAMASQGKMESFLGEFLPHVQAGLERIDREMPRGTKDQNIARAVAMMRWNGEFRRRGA